MREPLNRQVASTRPSWPAVAALVIGIGVIAGFELVRQERLSAALAVGLTLAIWAGLATLLLGRQIQSAHALALRDSLTGLPNRALLHDRIEQALARSRRTQEPFALLVVDLDGFKGVNDVRGHEAGNQVLRTIARRLESVVRATDTVARVGGDEFVVLSLGTAGDEEAAALVGRMRQALRRPYSVEGGHVEIDASIGWALFPQDGLEPLDLLAQADGQMYATKRDTSQESAVPNRTIDRGVIRDLESALERGQVVVHYQPIVDLNSGGVSAAEALVRREHPDRLVAPSEFIPHVEQTPLVRSLTLAVAADALRRLEEWDAAGHHLDVAVNVPYRMIDDAELVNGLGELLDSRDVEPRRLTLEIVPSGPGAGSELDRFVVKRLRNLGIRLSLDDLGRAASVAAIRTLPLDQVKIDAMFLHDVGRGGRSDAIVRSLVELAHRLGLETVAEGVESRIAWEAAAALGCDYAQGFYLGHPMPAGKLVEWLAGTWPVVPTADLEDDRPGRGGQRDDGPDRQEPQQDEESGCERDVADGVDRAGEDRIPERRCEHPDDGGAHADECRLDANVAPEGRPERQHAAEQEERRHVDRDERERGAGDAVRGGLLERAEVRGEGEQRPGHRLREPVSGKELLLGDPPRLDERLVEER